MARSQTTPSIGNGQTFPTDTLKSSRSALAGDTLPGTGRTTETAPMVNHTNDAVRSATQASMATMPASRTDDSAPATSAQPASREQKTRDYKNFVYGIYAGLNTTRFQGESANGNQLTGRLGYQAGFLVRAGGRLYGQLGAEYFASSAIYFRAGDGTSVSAIQDQINIHYVQVPVYVGYKLVQSLRGISAVRLKAGLEYANRISANSGSFNLNKSEIKSGTFNGLAKIGFDMRPVLLDLTYHHGFDNAVQAVNASGFAGSQRRVLSASLGWTF